jgi:hypothetical protein
MPEQKIISVFRGILKNQKKGNKQKISTYGERKLWHLA